MDTFLKSIRAAAASEGQGFAAVKVQALISMTDAAAGADVDIHVALQEASPWCCSPIDFINLAGR